VIYAGGGVYGVIRREVEESEANENQDSNCPYGNKIKLFVFELNFCDLLVFNFSTCRSREDFRCL
jgi:hypothetical protein